MLEIEAVAVINELALAKVAVITRAEELDEVAAVKAERTTEPEPLVETSPDRVVDVAVGAPPVPRAI
jgi:hypothetical protein